MINLKGWFHLGLFYSIGPIWTRLCPMNRVFYRPDCHPESLRKSDRLLFLNMLKTIPDQKPSSRGRLGRPRIWWGSGAYTPSTLRTTLGRERQRLYESTRGRSRHGDLQGTLGRPRRPWGYRARSSPWIYRVVFAGSRLFSQKRIRNYRNQNNPWWNGRLMYRHLRTVFTN